MKAMAASLQQILDDYHASRPDGNSRVIFPGRKGAGHREENTKNGIPVLKKVWDEIQQL